MKLYGVPRRSPFCDLNDGDKETVYSVSETNSVNGLKLSQVPPLEFTEIPPSVGGVIVISESIPSESGGTVKYTLTLVRRGTFSPPSGGEVEVTLNGTVANEKVYGAERYAPEIERKVDCTVTVYRVPARSSLLG